MAPELKDPQGLPDNVAHITAPPDSRIRDSPIPVCPVTDPHDEYQQLSAVEG